MKPFKKDKSPDHHEFGHKSGPLIAKKDFKIVHNEYVREIKVGDDLSDVPNMYLENLRTEQVL